MILTMHVHLSFKFSICLFFFLKVKFTLKFPMLYVSLYKLWMYGSKHYHQPEKVLSFSFWLILTFTFGMQPFSTIINFVQCRTLWKWVSCINLFKISLRLWWCVMLAILPHRRLQQEDCSNQAIVGYTVSSRTA